MSAKGMLTRHFSLAELTVTSKVDELGRPLNNTPGLPELFNLRRLCVRVLEPLRELWGCPVLVTSGFRSYRVELAVSGKDSGQHRLGEAADIVPTDPELDLEDAFSMLLTLPFDQAILEAKGSARWIHVSYTERHPLRRQALRWTPSSGYLAYHPQDPPQGATT